MLKQRIITALILAAAVLLVIFLAPHTLVMWVLAALMLAAAWEWSAFPGFSSLPSRCAYVAFIAGGLALVWFSSTVRTDTVLYAAALWWCLALLWIVTLPARANRALTALAGLFVLVPAWVALVLLHEYEPLWILFLLLLVVAADVGAYFAGRKFGRRKLAPQVSPGKTWEGVLGGFVGVGIMAWIGLYWFDVASVPFLALCIAVFVASVVGDLTESLFKRHAGLKDSGTLLPGHGGVLDRIDSVTAAAPLFVIGARQMGIL